MTKENIIRIPKLQSDFFRGYYMPAHEQHVTTTIDIFINAVQSVDTFVKWSTMCSGDIDASFVSSMETGMEWFSLPDLTDINGAEAARNAYTAIAQAGDRGQDLVNMYRQELHPHQDLSRRLDDICDSLTASGLLSDTVRSFINATTTIINSFNHKCKQLEIDLFVAPKPEDAVKRIKRKLIEAKKLDSGGWIPRRDIWNGGQKALEVGFVVHVLKKRYNRTAEEITSFLNGMKPGTWRKYHREYEKADDSDRQKCQEIAGKMGVPLQDP